MLRRRHLLAVLPVVALGATTALLVPGGAASAAPPPNTQGKTYVALGDSYAAGYGLPASQGTPTGQPVPGCAQTDGDYPHLLAASLGLDLTDVTCSGATTDDFANPQTDAGAQPQLDVFDTVQPDLVTITIGGNDLGFSSIAAACLAATKNGPIYLHPSFNSCKDYYTSNAPGNGSAVNPYNKVQAVLDKVDAAVKAVHAAAPNAKIAVIAYPAIAPDGPNTPAEGCYTAEAANPPIPLPGLPISVGSTLPFTDTDIPFLQVLQQQLDEGIAGVAADNGAAYADIYDASLAHSACAPEATRWVEPIIPAGGGTNSLHPNLAGTTAMAAALAPVVEALFPIVATSTPPTTTPSTSAVPSSSGASTVSNGGEPLANTGTPFPVGWTVGLAAVLLVAGAVSVRIARPSRGRH